MDQRHRALNAVLAAAAALALGGCPSPAPRPASTTAPPPYVSTPQPMPPLAPPPAQPPRPVLPPREYRLSAATQSLVTQARGQLAHGDMDGASATLDRALRIEPGNPLLWVELGKVRLVAGEAHAAEGCARKALSLASGDAAVQGQAGRVLADALRAQGRNQEAQQVESRPYMH